MQWLLQEKGKFLRAMELASGLLQIEIDRENGVVNLYGSVRATELAEKWLSTKACSAEVSSLAAIRSRARCHSENMRIELCLELFFCNVYFEEIWHLALKHLLVRLID